MTTSEAQEYLETAGHRLEATVNRLVGAPSSIDSVRAGLEEVIRTLRLLHDNRPLLASSQGISAQLATIRTRAARIQVLLDAANAFYCGSISGALRETSAYAPHGESSARLYGGHLRFEA